MQNAFATYQSMQFIGLFSFAPALKVHVWAGELHATAVCSAAAVAARLAFHVVSQPVSLELFGFLPAPDAIMPCEYAATNFLNRPTVISNLSRRKSLTVAG